MLEDIDKIMEMMRIEEESPIDDEIQLMKTFLDFESATGFKGFEVVHNIVLNIATNVQTEPAQMYDELRRSFETCNEMSTN